MPTGRGADDQSAQGAPGFKTVQNNLVRSKTQFACALGTGPSRKCAEDEVADEV